MPKHLIIVALLPLWIAGCLGGQSSASKARAPSAPSGSARASACGGEQAPLPCEGAEVSPQDRELVQSLAGEWHLAESDAEAQIDRAISDVTAQMNVFVRGIAKERIEEEVNPDERVLIEPAGDGIIVVAIGPGQPVRLALNGPPVQTVDTEGRPLRTRAILRGDALCIEEQSEQGTRTVTLQRRDTGLVMTARIRSDQLPDAIVYRLSYRRAEAGEVAIR